MRLGWEIWAILGLVFLSGIMLCCGLSAVWADPDCHRDYDHRALPDGKCYCLEGAVTAQEGCEENPANTGWPIEKWNNDQYCGWLRDNPHQEHRDLIYYEHALCVKGGGREQGGEDITHCVSPGLFSASISLPGILDGATIRRQAYVCSKATGIPTPVLYHALGINDKQFEPANCGFWKNWTKWPGGFDRGAVRDVPGEWDVPKACYDWSI